MDELHYLGMLDVGALIAAREVSAVEVVSHQLSRIAALDPALHSFARTMPDQALEQARLADEQVAAGRICGPLHGVPIAVKDLFWTRDVVTAAGTRIHAGFVPGEDATAVARLKAAGAVLLGKLTTCEAAYSVHHPDVDVPVNPWNDHLWSGASSSGSGVAIAAGLCFGALGTDTSGSIRLPAAINGVVGLKPTWGRISRHGIFDAAPSLDHAGPLTRRVGDAAAMLQVLAGADPADRTASTWPVDRYVTTAPDRIGLRIGFDPRQLDMVDAATRGALEEAADVFARAGAALVAVDVPVLDDMVDTILAVAGPELASAHAATFPSRRCDYGEPLASFIDGAGAISAEARSAAARARADLRSRMDRLFESIDVLLVPTMTIAFLDRARMLAIGDDMAALDAATRYTCPFNLTGFPALALPAGFDVPNRCPISMQLVARPFREDLLFETGLAFEAMTDWHRRHPEIPARS